MEANEPNTFFTHMLEVDKAKLGGVFKVSGRFSFQVHRGDTQITEQWVEINAITGSLGEGTMRNMSETPSIIQNDLVVTYGFYDAGSGGESGLTSMDQCYVTVTPNYSKWQEDLVQSGSGDDKPFSRFVLPAVHDVGMNTMQNAVALLAHSGDALIKMVMERFKLTGQMHFGLGDKAIAKIAPAIIVSLSITQKDTLPAMLAIGARYFEFRPAFCVDKLQPVPIPDTMYFQHACIPGMAFEEFLEGVVAFLVEHQNEIVVTQLRYDGILDGCRRPSDQELDDMINRAIDGRGIIRGTADDLHLSINELRSTGRRLLIFNPVSSFSTYTDEANATTNGDSIIEQFEQMSAEKQNGQTFTNIQCQATATNIRNAVIYSAISANASNSCLMSTKAICDAKTLPWIRDHALEKLTEEQLVVCMVCFSSVFGYSGY